MDSLVMQSIKRESLLPSTLQTRQGLSEASPGEERTEMEVGGLHQGGMYSVRSKVLQHVSNLHSTKPNDQSKSP